MRKRITLIIIAIALVITAANFGSNIYFARQGQKEVMEKETSGALNTVEGLGSSVQSNILFVAVAFFIFNIIIAIMFSGYIVNPFYESERLNETVKAQAIEIQEERDRARLILDAMPLSCHLWDKDVTKVFDCNEANLRLFEVSDRKEFSERFFDLSPEYQPDGRHSRETGYITVKKAFEEGMLVFEWIHQKLDGTPIPCEVTLKRLKYGDGYVVASYVRDLREHKRIMKEFEYRDKLLDTVNSAAAILLKIGN